MYDKAYESWMKLLDLSLKFCGASFCKQMIGRLKKSWVLSGRSVQSSWKKDYAVLAKKLKQVDRGFSMQARALCLEVADLLSKYPPNFTRVEEKLTRLSSMEG